MAAGFSRGVILEAGDASRFMAPYPIARKISKRSEIENLLYVRCVVVE
jgi:hypothetical protein